MAKHRNQARFDRADWRLVILLPCWLTQMPLILVMIGISAYLLANDINDDVEVQATAEAWLGINIGFSTISVLLTCYEILSTVTESLTPKIMLASNLIKLFGAILSTIMDGLIMGSDLNSWAEGSLVIHSLLIISTLAPGSYAAWKWKCLAAYDEYHIPGNVKPFGYNSDAKNQGKSGHNRVPSDDTIAGPDLEFGNRVEICGGSTTALVMAPSPGEPPADYTEATRERGSSFTRIAGRMNFSMSNNVDEINANAQQSHSDTASPPLVAETAYDPVAQQMAQITEPEITLPKRPRPTSFICITGTGSDRRASYNHTRDTSYEEYVREQKEKQRVVQRSSQGLSIGLNSSIGADSAPATTSSSASPEPSDSAAAYRLSLNLKNEVDDAMGTGFGWGAGSRSSSMDSVMAGGQRPAIAVGGGVASTTKHVRDSLGRAPSDGSEAASFGSVPRSSTADGAEAGVDERKQGLIEASRALLGEAVDDHIDHPESLRPGKAKSTAIAFVVTPPPSSSVDENPIAT